MERADFELSTDDAADIGYNMKLSRTCPKLRSAYNNPLPFEQLFTTKRGATAVRLCWIEAEFELHGQRSGPKVIKFTYVASTHAYQ